MLLKYTKNDFDIKRNSTNACFVLSEFQDVMSDYVNLFPIFFQIVGLLRTGFFIAVWPPISKIRNSSRLVVRYKSVQQVSYEKVDILTCIHGFIQFIHHFTSCNKT